MPELATDTLTPVVGESGISTTRSPSAVILTPRIG